MHRMSLSLCRPWPNYLWWNLAVIAEKGAMRVDEASIPLESMAESLYVREWWTHKSILT